MLAKVFSAAVVGLEAVPITVEVDIASQGLPSFSIVGLPDKAVEESKERVRAAIKNSGAEFPAKRIIVNLAPADLPKAGPAYDLPIALGILRASEQLVVSLDTCLCIGELSLDGSLRHTNGIVSFAQLAKEKQLQSIFVPLPDADEAAIISDVAVYGVPSLLALYYHLTDKERLVPTPHRGFQVMQDTVFASDMADIQGQEQVKRVMEIAAAGGHNVFLEGPPGAGKTMIARTFPSILPTLTEKEALEVTKIYSVTGNLPPGTSLVKHRPFRSPHHTTSRVGLIGGGTHPAPGEISLAHRGVLFLDEFPEFPRSVLEALRQPLEDGVVAIARAAGAIVYPAKFLLVAAANPCPCGYFGSASKTCICTAPAVNRYKKRLSGPIMDRIDLHLHVPAVAVDKLTTQTSAEPSAVIQQRVQKARDKQRQRFANVGIIANAEMSTKHTKTLCTVAGGVSLFLAEAAKKMGLSARSYYRILKVSRTIADLSGEENVSVSHVAEALQYRSRSLQE